MRYAILVMMFLLTSVPTPLAKEQSEAQEVGAMLDRWYEAAARGDGPGYFSHFADDAIFLGTDPDERWALQDFRARFESSFDGRNPAWIYVAKERHVLFSPDHKIGWFDERLQSPHLGELRGTGVVVKLRGTWKIEHYSLTFLISNGVVEELAKESACRPVWTAHCKLAGEK